VPGCVTERTVEPFILLCQQGYLLGAGLMVGAGLAVALAVAAERRSLEDIARPLTALRGRTQESRALPARAN